VRGRGRRRWRQLAGRALRLRVPWPHARRVFSVPLSNGTPLQSRPLAICRLASDQAGVDFLYTDAVDLGQGAPGRGRASRPAAASCTCISFVALRAKYTARGLGDATVGAQA
jgi:hypothetical protein